MSRSPPMAGTPETEGRQLGDYLLLNRIAVGGMGEVFRARSDRVRDGSELYAVKVLLPQYSRDPEIMQALADEARLNIMLSHRNLVRVYELDVANREPYLAMELVDGPSLDELHQRILAQGALVPLTATLFVVAEVLRALSYVHEAEDGRGVPLRIVHRDVSPHNVLLSREGEVKLGDFGIARSAIRSVRTRTGFVKGKLRYLAPEQATRSAIDARADLYNVGLILFELLTGQPFLCGESEMEILKAAASPEHVAPSSLRADTPDALDALVERALRRFPEERFQTARGFLTELLSTADALGLRGDAAELARLVAETPPIPREAGAPLPRLRRPTDATVPDNPMADVRTAPRQPISSQSRSSRTKTGWVAAAVLVAAVAATVSVFWGDLPTETRERTTESPSRASPAPEPAAKEASRAEAETREDRQASSRERKRRKPSRRRRAVATPVQDAASSSKGHPRSSHEAAQTESPGPDAASLGALSGRLAALRSQLRGRGILRADLDTEQQAAMARTEKLLADGRAEKARPALDDLERRLALVVVNAGFVEKKIQRVDKLIRAVRDKGIDSARVDRLAQEALDAFMAGRYEPANRTLNRICALLAP